jgi:hypothetical protein
MTDAGTSEEVVLGHPLPTISDQFMQERLTTVKSFTAVLLRTTASFSPDARPIVWEHGRRNFALMEAGIAALVLPAADDTDWAGLYVFTVGPDEARTVMDADPGVLAGIFTYEIHPVRGFPGSGLPG